MACIGLCRQDGKCGAVASSSEHLWCSLECGAVLQVRGSSVVQFQFQWASVVQFRVWCSLHSCERLCYNLNSTRFLLWVSKTIDVMLTVALRYLMTSRGAFTICIIIHQTTNNYQNKTNIFKTECIWWYCYTKNKSTLCHSRVKNITIICATGWSKGTQICLSA